MGAGPRDTGDLIRRRRPNVRCTTNPPTSTIDTRGFSTGPMGTNSAPLTAVTRRS
jgi:hypothetical protein